MSTAAPSDTTPLRKSQSTSKSKEHTVDYLDLSTTEERTSSEDATYAAALELLNGEGF